MTLKSYYSANYVYYLKFEKKIRKNYHLYNVIGVPFPLNRVN